jgi:hypothetical protein
MKAYLEELRDRVRCGRTMLKVVLRHLRLAGDRIDLPPRLTKRVSA